MNQIDNLEIEDMPNETLQEMAKLIGLLNVRKILKKFAGQRINIPKTLRGAYYRKQIRLLHFRDNLKNSEIAERLGISEIWVYKCLRAMK